MFRFPRVKFSLKKPGYRVQHFLFVSWWPCLYSDESGASGEGEGFFPFPNPLSDRVLYEALVIFSLPTFINEGFAVGRAWTVESELSLC